jgi:phosphoheptose isomerase
MNRPFLILDRDGTLIREREYLSEPAGVELLSGAGAVIRKAREVDWGVLVITNQSGVGRGMFTMADVEAVNARIQEVLGGEDARVDGFLICPHGPDEACDCRKPARGLGDRAATEYGVDLRASVVIGDKLGDLQFGRAIGAATVLVRTGYGEETADELADYVIDDLQQAARIVEEQDRVRRHLDESIRVKTVVRDSQIANIVSLANAVALSMAGGGKLLICGNGGSAADSQHLATEFVVRLSSNFERPALPAIALTVDSSILTASGNDHGFQRVFARQIEALGKPGDVLLAISTSGNSHNILAAVETAKALGLCTLGLLGGDGGKLGKLVDLSVIVPSATTMYVQESHIAIYHLICDLVERRLFLV